MTYRFRLRQATAFIVATAALTYPLQATATSTASPLPATTPMPSVQAVPQASQQEKAPASDDACTQWIKTGAKEARARDRANEQRDIEAARQART